MTTINEHYEQAQLSMSAMKRAFITMVDPTIRLLFLCRGPQEVSALIIISSLPVNIVRMAKEALA